jgi:hypothetical protein
MLSDREPVTRRRVAFEIASGITAGVSILIKVVRQLYVAVTAR